jgi:hypothetical protein
MGMGLLRTNIGPITFYKDNKPVTSDERNIQISDEVSLRYEGETLIAKVTVINGKSYEGIAVTEIYPDFEHGKTIYFDHEKIFCVTKK